MHLLTICILENHKFIGLSIYLLIYRFHRLTEIMHVSTHDQLSFLYLLKIIILVHYKISFSKHLSIHIYLD
jgi:hypothetical protein